MKVQTLDEVDLSAKVLTGTYKKFLPHKKAILYLDGQEIKVYAYRDKGDKSVLTLPESFPITFMQID